MTAREIQQVALYQIRVSPFPDGDFTMNPSHVFNGTLKEANHRYAEAQERVQPEMAYLYKQSGEGPWVLLAVTRRTRKDDGSEIIETRRGPIMTRTKHPGPP